MRDLRPGLLAIALAAVPAAAPAQATPVPVDRRSCEADSATAGLAPSPTPDSYRLSAVEEEPVVTNRGEVAREIARRFPPELRHAGVSGTATVRLRVDPGGRPRCVTAVEETHPGLGPAAVAVAQRMRFRPAKVSGRPVSVWISLPVRFRAEPPPPPATGPARG